MIETRHATATTPGSHGASIGRGGRAGERATHARARPGGRPRRLRARGAAIIEFAILLPILVTLLLGVMDFGFMLYDKAAITNAAREAARAAIVLRSPRIDEAAIKQVATDYCSTHLVTMSGASSCTVAVKNVTTPASSNCQAFAETLQVKVQYRYDGPILGLLGGFSNGLYLTSTSVMKCE